MNYIIEINAFYEWLDTHTLSRSSVALWHALMQIDNKTHWQKSFTVAISTLQLKARLTRVELFKARAELIEAGLITCTPREKQKSAMYSLLPFYLDNGSPAPRLPDSNQDNPTDVSDSNQDNPTDNSDNNQQNPTDVSDNNQKNATDDSDNNQQNPIDVSDKNQQNPIDVSDNNQQNTNGNPNDDPVENPQNPDEKIANNDEFSNKNCSKNEEFLNKNTSKNDPDSKLNKKKLNFEQDKSCLSSDDDERQNQKDLFGKDISPTENSDPGDTHKVKPKKRMTEHDVMKLYNKICVDLPPATKLTDIRKGHISARMKEFDDDTIKLMLQQAAKSEFLAQGNEMQWTANIDWLFLPTNFVKVLEGHYAFLRPAKNNIKNFIGKPSPFEVLQEAYDGIMNHESEY